MSVLSDPETRGETTSGSGRSSCDTPNEASAAKGKIGEGPKRSVLHVASAKQERTSPPNETPSSAPDAHEPRHHENERTEPPGSAPAHAAPAEVRPPNRFAAFARATLRNVATLAVLALAVLAGLIIWDYYVTAPWTRDGRIRVQVASIAPQVSGQITDLRVADNQFVHKGDVLYVIDPFDFQVSLDSAKTQLRMKAADLQVKQVQAERRQHLSDLATTPEEQQQYVGNATQAQAAFDAAQQQVNQANINLKRTQVMSPVNGFVTNLLMRVGDYAHEGTSNISVIDADSYWIDGYFEETKMARICVGDVAEAQLMGYRDPILGRVRTVTRGISVSDAAPSTQGLPNVDPVYTWVRLAQRVPVRIAITGVPRGVPLVSGMTATVTIRDAAAQDDNGWFAPRLGSLKDRIRDIVERPQPHARCVPTVGLPSADTQTIDSPESPAALAPDQINPGLTPSMTASPKPDR